MRFVVMALLTGLLVACGGGGGGSGAAAPTTHVVTATALAGGTISPASATVAAGTTATFTVTAASGYAIASVTGCGGSLAGTSYTTAAVGGACAVTVAFSPLDFHVDVTGTSLGGLALENNGADRINVSTDGRYTFTVGINVGATHSVRVAQQPLTQACRVSNGDGVISATSAAVVVHCVNRIVAQAPLTLRTELDNSGQFEQFLYFRSVNTNLHQFRINVADGRLAEIAPAWSLPPYPQTFTFSADASRVFADDGLGTVSQATVRPSDGAVIPTWTATFGNYLPQLPVLLTPARPSHDGRLLYRNVAPIIGGIRYDDLWVGTTSDTGVSMLGSSPFALGSDGGTLNFDPSGRYFVRLLRNGRHLDVYRAFTSTTQQPELLHPGTQTLQAPSVTLFAEGAPGKYLFEASLASESAAGQSLPPQIAIHAWQENGSLTPLGGAVEGGPLTGEIASQVCIPSGLPTTSRLSFFGPLPPATVRPSRYLLQRQDTSCIGIGGGLADTRVLGVYLLTVANGQAARTKLPLDTRPEWPDLGVTGWVHRTKPVLYLGSKHSQRIYAYAVDEVAGTVQPLAGSPFEVQPMPAAGVVSAPALLMDPTDRYLYLARLWSGAAASTFIAAFSVDATTGALTPIATYTP